VVACADAAPGTAAGASTSASTSIAPPPVFSVNPQLDTSLPYRNLAFYIISAVQDAADVVEEHRAFLAEREMVGRVYICGANKARWLLRSLRLSNASQPSRARKQSTAPPRLRTPLTQNTLPCLPSADGINAQVSGTPAQCAQYRDLCHAQLGPGAGAPILFKEDPVAELAYPRLRVKHRGLVAQTEGEGEGAARVNLAERAVDLSPEVFTLIETLSPYYTERIPTHKHNQHAHCPPPLLGAGGGFRLLRRAGIYICIYLSIYLSIYISVFPSNLYLSIYLSIYPSIHPSMCMHIHMHRYV